MRKRLLRSVFSALLVLSVLTATDALAPPPAGASGPTIITVSSITTDQTWTPDGSPYILSTTPIVKPGATLRILPGTVIKGQTIGTNLMSLQSVGGRILAIGTPDNPIIFTSYKDDSDGHDSNGDGNASTPENADWAGLRFDTPTDSTATPPMSFIANAEIRYVGDGGTNNSCASGAAFDVRRRARLSVRDSKVTHVTAAFKVMNTQQHTELFADNIEVYGFCGMEMSNATGYGKVVVANSRFHTTQGALIHKAPQLELRNNVFSGLITSGSVSNAGNVLVRGNDILGGWLYSGSTVPSADLRYNWWGHTNIEQTPTGCEGTYPPYPQVRYVTWQLACPTKYAATGHKQTVYPALSGPLNSTEREAIPAEHMFGSGSGTHGNDPSVRESDPVNTATGNFISNTADVVMPGVGEPFMFARSYNSMDDRVGVLGRGWTHNWAVSLEFDSVGNATFMSEDGATFVFEKVPATGAFVPAAGVTSKLSAVTGGYTVTTKAKQVYQLDSSGKLTSLTDPNNNAFTVAYDGSGLIDSVTDTAGRAVDFAHDTNGRLASVTLPDSRSVSYAYTAGGLLETVTDLRGGVVTYRYDGSDRLDRIADQNGHHVVTNVYGTNGRVEQQTDAEGEVSTFSWDALTQTSVLTDANGGTHTTDYDGGVVQSQTDPLGNTTVYQHDGDHNVTAVTDPLGNTTRMFYDPNGNMLLSVAPDGTMTEFEYDSNDRPIKTKDPLGRTTTFAYDTAGNPTTVTRPGSNVTSTTYTTAGQPATVTDPRNKTTTFGYDTDGNLASVTSPLGHVETYAYDQSGRMTSRAEARGNESGATPADYTWTYTYDDANNVLTETRPLGAVVTTTYDPVGNVLSVTDPNNEVTSFQYDLVNRLTVTTHPDLTTVLSSYDPVGNRLTSTDANGHVTTFDYDLANRLVQQTSAEGNVTTYTYDAAGRLTSTTDPEGNSTVTAGDGTVTYSYDTMGRPTTVDYSDPATPDITNAYDAAGRLLTASTATDTLSYAYDQLDRTTSVALNNVATTYTYDAAGNVLTRTYPASPTVTTTYDDDGRPATTTVAGQGTSTWAWDAAGRLTAAAHGNGSSESRSWDRDGRLDLVTVTDSASAVIGSHDYAYDTAGRPTSETTLTETLLHEYDERGRLTETCRQATACTGPADPFTRWTYDGVGNRLSEETPAGTDTYVYDDDSRLTSVTGTGPAAGLYAWNRNGQRTTDPSRTYTWRQDGLMASVSAGLDTWTYDYAPDGTRTGIVTGLLGTDERLVDWDRNGMPTAVSEHDGSSTLLRTWGHGPAGVLSESDGSVAAWHHGDMIGTSATVTGPAGLAAHERRWDPWGGLLSSANPDPAVPAQSAGWAGEPDLAGAGLVHLRARDYDPATGQFVSVDPLVEATQEPYAYASGAPTHLTDPLGLWPDCLVGKNPNGSCRGSNPLNTLNAINTASGVVAGVAGICAIVTSPTVVGGLSCGSVAAGAAVVNLGTGLALVRLDKKSWSGFALDAGLTATGWGSSRAVLSASRFAANGGRSSGILRSLGVPSVREVTGEVGASLGKSVGVLSNTAATGVSASGLDLGKADK